MLTGGAPSKSVVPVLYVNTIKDMSGGTIDLTDATVTLKDGSTLGSDAISKVKSGQYTGDGGVSQGITGIGFQPKLVLIFIHRTAIGGDHMWIGWANQFNDISIQNQAYGASGGVNYDDDHLLSLDADGFTVDDNGGNSHPNTNAATYDFVCFG